MQITETASEGLKRSYKVVVGSDAIEENIQKKITAIGDQARLPGFRPGKIPPKVLRARFGKSILGEVLQETVDETLRKTLDDNKIRPALQPKVEVSSFDEGKDLEYTMEVELLPEIVPADFSTIELERLVAEIDDSEVDRAIESIADQQKTFAAEEGAAAKDGDAVLIDFEGSIDGELFEGGAGTDSQIQLGSGQFVPGFEEQLVGAKGGEDREVKVTFPSDYPYEKLRDKNAVFKVTVKEVRKPSIPPVDDALVDAFVDFWGAALSSDGRRAKLGSTDVDACRSHNALRQAWRGGNNDSRSSALAADYAGRPDVPDAAGLQNLRAYHGGIAGVDRPADHGRSSTPPAQARHRDPDGEVRVLDGR